MIRIRPGEICHRGCTAEAGHRTVILAVQSVLHAKMPSGKAPAATMGHAAGQTPVPGVGTGHRNPVCASCSIASPSGRARRATRKPLQTSDEFWPSTSTVLWADVDR